MLLCVGGQCDDSSEFFDPKARNNFVYYAMI
jgi:hypothetical protein